MINVFLSSFSMGEPLKVGWNESLGTGSLGRRLGASVRNVTVAHRRQRVADRSTPALEDALQVDRRHRVDAVALLVQRHGAQLLFLLVDDVNDGAVPAD